MKRSELKKYIEENITEILGEADIDVANPAALNPQSKQALINKARATTKNPKLGTADDPVNFFEAKDEDEEVEDTYNKEDEDDKKDAKIKAAEPKPSDLKKIDKEFNSTKLAKELSTADKEKLDKLEAGIKKKLANPTKDNIEIVRQLIKKAEIKKLFKDGGKDLKALISDIIR
jgi:hypothetical protein